MLKIETYEQTTVREKYYVFCDICGKEIEEKWNDTPEEVKIEFTYEYNNWPEGGNDARLVYDICPECFKKEIKPFLDSKVTPRVVERDW